MVVCVAGIPKFTDLGNQSAVNFIGDSARALFPFFVTFGFAI